MVEIRRVLREQEPVHHYAPFDCWLLTRHEDVSAVLRELTAMQQRLDQLYARWGELEP